MQLSVTFRHLESSDALKEYSKARLEKLDKYMKGPIEAHVVLTLEKFRHYAEVTILDRGTKFTSQEEGFDMYQALDNAIDKIERQVKKYKEKLKNHSAPNRNEYTKEIFIDDTKTK